MKKGKILIISHLFFPEIGIGGNRWYKFSNELSKYFEIDLLTSYSNLKKNYDYSEIDSVSKLITIILHTIININRNELLEIIF